jgi:NADH:ubiquinone oxidoreductase subunit 4 (subunit M)
MVQNIIMGDVTDFLKSLGDKLTDVGRIEAATLAPLVLLAVLLGLFPALVLELTQMPVETVLSIVESAADTAVETTTGLLP